MGSLVMRLAAASPRLQPRARGISKGSPQSGRNLVPGDSTLIAPARFARARHRARREAAGKTSNQAMAARS